MNKALNVLYVVLVFIGWLWFTVQFILLILLPWQPVQDFLQKEISRAAGRPVQAQRISARISGFVLQDVKVASSAENAAQGELFQARRVQLRWSPWALLRGRLKIKTVLLDGLDLHIIRYADGTFNFDGFFGAGEAPASAAPAEASGLPLDLSIRNLHLTNSHIVFTDEMLHQTLQANDLFLSVQHFTFDKAFPLSLNAALTYTPDGQESQSAQLGFTLWPDLHNGDWAAASLRIKRLVFKRSGGVMVLSGEVKNLQAPSLQLQVQGEDLSHTMLRFLYPALPVWSIQNVKIALSATADVLKKQAVVSALDIQAEDVAVASSDTISLPALTLPQASFYLSGTADWGKKQVAVSSFTVQGRNIQAAAPDNSWQADVPAMALELAAAGSAAQQTIDLNALRVEISSATVRAEQAPYGPEVYFPYGSVYACAKADLANKRAEVSSFTASLWSSFVASSGTVTWGDKPSVSGQSEFELNLRTIGEGLAVLKPYQLRGTVLGKAAGSPENSSAQIDFQAVAGIWPQGGKLTEFDTRATITDLKKIELNHFSGKWNGDVFRGAFSAVRGKDAVNADLTFYAKRLALSPMGQAAAKPEDAKAASSPSAAPAAQDGAPANALPVNLKAQIDIDSLDTSYLWGTDIHFKADMQNVTSSLAQAHGQLSLQTGSGEIKDLDHLTQANLLSRVLFTSLSAVSKVINSLNVFAVLNGLGQGMIDVLSDKNKDEKPADMVVQVVKDENGNDIEIMVPYTEQKVDGRLAFELFTTDMTFTDGTANLQKGSFVSDLMSFNLTGDMNFQNQQLNMKVNAAPGRHYDDGIMPLTLTVGGTMDNPTGSMNMTSSITSFVTQGVANNFASRTVKKGLGGIFGLFKKKDKSDEAKEVSAAKNSTPAKEDVSAARADDAAKTAEAFAEKAAPSEGQAPADGQETQAPASEQALQPAETNTSGISAEPKPTHTTQNIGWPDMPAKPTETTQNIGLPDLPAKPTETTQNIGLPDLPDKPLHTTQNTALPNPFAQPEPASEDTSLPLPPATPEGFVGGKGFAPAD